MAEQTSIAKAIAEVTATPTTTSTGRDASPPAVGGLRFLIFGCIASVITALGGWACSAFQPGPDGTVVHLTPAIIMTGIGVALAAAADYIRRISAQKATADTHV